mmetsp:Transcript_64129/g.123368  ORF Transcript_64129/g.123368 Transcript_64129/m.123368 type:complete len:214 (-) Transcript_64129:85-726(-)
MASSQHTFVTSLLHFHESLVEFLGVVEARGRWLWKVIFREIGIVRVEHPWPIWMPWKIVLCDPSATTLCAATIQVAGDRVRVLYAFTFLRGLQPLNRVTLWSDTNTARILEYHHGGQGPEHKVRRDNPHRKFLEPCPIWRIVLCKVPVINSVEDSRRKECPVFPLVAMVPNWFMEWILLWRAIGLKLRWRRWRQVKERRRATKAQCRSADAAC